MDRSGEVEELEEIAEFTLTDEELVIILKGLDLYGYSLIMSEGMTELNKVKNIAIKIISQLPRTGLNS